MSIQEQLRALIARHCATIRHTVEAIGRSLEETADPWSSAGMAVARAEALAHQLKGSSGSVGFHGVSAAATALDDRLKVLCAADATVIASQMPRVRALYEALQEEASSLTPQSSTLYNVELPALREEGKA